MLILDNSPREQTEYPCSLVPSPSDPGNRKVQKGGLRVQSPGELGKEGRAEGPGRLRLGSTPPPTPCCGRGGTGQGTRRPGPRVLRRRTVSPGKDWPSQLMIPVGVRMTLRPACTCLSAPQSIPCPLGGASLPAARPCERTGTRRHPSTCRV